MVVSKDIRGELLEQVRELAVIHGQVTLSSGGTSDWYADMRQVTLHGPTSCLIGDALLELSEDWTFDAVGGLTMGADPVASAVMNAYQRRGIPMDVFIVRKDVKAHGTQQQVEGPSISGRRVVVVEDVSTTGTSAQRAVSAARAAGAQVIGVLALLDRGGLSVLADDGHDARGLYSVHDVHPAAEAVVEVDH